MTKPSRDSKRPVKIEVQSDYDYEEEALGFPRMVARIWGLIASISYISSGGYLMVHHKTTKCNGIGIYMLVTGLVMLGFECPCFLLIIKSNKCCTFIDKKVPFWVKGVFYVGSVVPPLALCFNLKTMLTSLTVIILALLYFFLTCLQGNARYKRLQGDINAHFKQAKQTASVSYSSISHANATISAFQSASRNKHHLHVPKHGKVSSKKVKTRV